MRGRRFFSTAQNETPGGVQPTSTFYIPPPLPPPPMGTIEEEEPMEDEAVDSSTKHDLKPKDFSRPFPANLVQYQSGRRSSLKASTYSTSASKRDSSVIVLCNLFISLCEYSSVNMHICRRSDKVHWMLLKIKRSTKFSLMCHLNWFLLVALHCQQLIDLSDGRCLRAKMWKINKWINRHID